MQNGNHKPKICHWFPIANTYVLSLAKRVYIFPTLENNYLRFKIPEK